MPEAANFNWPTKLKKFSITDPFLKVLATKYEAEIPWQTVVRDEETLRTFVKDQLLPDFLNRCRYSGDATKRSFHVTSRHVNLDAALANHEGLDPEELSLLRKTLASSGPNAAASLLAVQINQKKDKGFNVWLAQISKSFPGEEGFQLLVVRSLFEIAGYGARRVLFEPAAEILQWVHRRIAKGLVLPTQHIGKLYCLKMSGAYTGVVRQDGWNYIPAGRGNASTLNVISRGSGWCIAGRIMAEYYLQTDSFYILTCRTKPVVALRVGGSGMVIECQGQANRSPAHWWQDIQFFLETMDLKMSDGGGTMAHALAQAVNINQESLSWWQQRIQLWPFAVVFAPASISDALKPVVQQTAVGYGDLEQFEKLRMLADLPPDLGLSENEWSQKVRLYPLVYGKCPAALQSLPSIQRACVAGWIEKIEEYDVAWSDLEKLPAFILADTGVASAIANHLPTDIHKLIRKHRSTLAERTNPVSLDSIIPFTEGEPDTLSVERMTNILINIEDGVYENEKFPAGVRQSSRFDDLRLQAWREGIAASAPLWFALPQDLKLLDLFLPITDTPKRVDLDQWCLKLEQMPWLLTQKNRVPKSITQHIRVLEA